ncbi:MAG: C10 family peptidase [Bacteroidales bacterium]|nr:C10 family peptidase [Bacteroidales bacterium]
MSYTTRELFHINWGWGGNGDGYYYFPSYEGGKIAHDDNTDPGYGSNTFSKEEESRNKSAYLGDPIYESLDKINYESLKLIGSVNLVKVSKRNKYNLLFIKEQKI